jgi:hypothetical protein
VESVTAGDGAVSSVACGSPAGEPVAGDEGVQPTDKKERISKNLTRLKNILTIL